MQTVELRPMTSDEYQAFREWNIPDYARDKVKSGDFPPEDAMERATAEFEQLLPDGPETEGNLVYTAVDAGTPVGGLWLALPTPTRRHAWIYDVWVQAELRGRGYGRAIMLAGEEALRERGITELGLNVFGPNATARHLYDSLGYEVVAQQMIKPLSPPEAR